MKPFLTLFALALLLASCSPLRVVRVSPEESAPVSKYLYGNAVLSDTQEGVQVDVSYYDASPEVVVFNLDLTNNTDGPINFDPVSAALVDDFGKVNRALDPEAELLGMDIRVMKRAKNQRTMAWVGAGLVVAGAAVAIATDAGSSTAGGGGQAAVADAGGGSFYNFSVDLANLVSWTVYDRQNERERHYALPEDIPTPDSRYFWLDHAFRLTTVGPGETAVGKVVFARNDAATSYDFTLGVEGRNFSFPFVQQVFRP